MVGKIKLKINKSVQNIKIKYEDHIITSNKIDFNFIHIYKNLFFLNWFVKLVFAHCYFQ